MVIHLYRSVNQSGSDGWNIITVAIFFYTQVFLTQDLSQRLFEGTYYILVQ